MRKKVNRCECLGGPLDGRDMSVRDSVICAEDSDGRRHFYRLCRCSLWDERHPDVTKYATYYHYLGEQMTNEGPYLVPHRRMFK